MASMRHEAYHDTKPSFLLATRLFVSLNEMSIIQVSKFGGVCDDEL